MSLTNLPRGLCSEIFSPGAPSQSANTEQKKSLNQAQVNRLGYWLLGRKRIDEAIEVFKMNVEDYPDSSNAYDSLGEAYAIKGDKEQAIKNYQKSIELNPDNTNGIQKLKLLREQ